MCESERESAYVCARVCAYLRACARVYAYVHACVCIMQVIQYYVYILFFDILCVPFVELVKRYVLILVDEIRSCGKW